MRARYYDPADGRFQSRDTWSGDVNRPLSLNRWMYVEGNPVNLVDPTGKSGESPWRKPCFSMNDRVGTAEVFGIFSSTDYLNTYTAAGLGVQCAGTDNPFNEYSGNGIGQITKKQTETEYGEIIAGQRGGGVRCYIAIGGSDDRCTICETQEYMEDKYGSDYRNYFHLEPVHDPNDPYWAQVYMRRRIKQVVDACVKCSSTDIFVAAALAQNGSGFDRITANDVTTPGSLWRERRNDVNWLEYFKFRIANKGYQGWFDTQYQLQLFAYVTHNLKNKNWHVPSDLDWPKIWNLAFSPIY